MTDSHNQGALLDAGKIIERFGGIRPMASKMSVPVTTVQGWKKRDVIPENRREDVLRAAVVNNIDLSDLIDRPPANENAGAPPKPAAPVTVAPPVTQATAPSVPSSPGAAAAAEALPESYDDTQLMAWIRRAEKRAVQKSALLFVFVLSVMMIFVVFVLFPRESQITALEQKVNQEEAMRASESSVLPADVSETIRQLKEQVQTLQHDLDASAKRIDALTGMNGSSMNPALLIDRVSKLEQQVAAFAGPAGLQALSERIQTMEQTPEGRKTLATAVGSLASLAGATQDPAQLDTVLQQAPQQNTALEELMGDVPAADMRQAVMMLIDAQLRQSLERGTSVIETVVLLQKMVSGQESDLATAVAKLAPDAAQSVTTTTELSGELSSLTPAIVKASLQGQDMIDQAKASLGSLVEVRKDGNLVSGTDTQATLDRAQQALKDGNVADALKEIDSLPEDARKLAQPFADKAKITLEVQQVSSLLAVGQEAAGAKELQSTGAEPASANH